MVEKYDDEKFGKQFFISEPSVCGTDLEEWMTIRLSPGRQLRSHPALPVVEVKRGAWHLVGLGDFIDPANQLHSNGDIVDCLTKSLEAEDMEFSGLETLLSKLAGRWVIIATNASSTRIYHDACGLKSVFFTTDRSQPLTVASQPALLEHLNATRFDQEVFSEFYKGSNPGAWPVYLLPYHDVEQLMPNHCLDLNRGEALRYWPVAAIRERSVEQVAPLMGRLISNVIGAMAHRGELSFSVTGGIDSRMLLACCPKEVLKSALFFTVKSRLTPGFDIWIPRAIADITGINYKVIAPDQPSNQTRVLHTNVGSMYLDDSVDTIETLASAVAGRVHGPGLTGEVLRCQYYPDGNHPREIDTEELARRSGFGDNLIVRPGISRWLESAPKDMGIPVLELYYWECRYGIWGACGMTFKEPVVDQIPPLNLRSLFELGLSVPIVDRIQPHRLTRKVVEWGSPVLDGIPYNQSRLAWLNNLLQAVPLPWRVRRWLKLL